MSAPHHTYTLVASAWSERSLDWASIRPQGPLPLPLLDDINWDLVNRHLPPTGTSNQPLRVPVGVQRTAAIPADHPRGLQFGTYECAITMPSRDILYRPSERLPVAHVSEPTGWALVPCVAMRLCRLDTQLHVYAVRYAEHISQHPNLNCDSPEPGTYNSEHVFTHAHPLKVDPPRILLIRVPEWLRRPLQVLFHTAAYMYYARSCDDPPSLASFHSDPSHAAYYFRLMSTLFTELAQLKSLELMGHRTDGYLATLHHHLVRESGLAGVACHTVDLSERLLRAHPYAYELDVSRFDWDDYYRRIKLFWTATMSPRSSFAYWRAHRCLSLDFFTDNFLLDYTGHHLPVDMTYRTLHGDPSTHAWFLLPGDYPPGFDQSPSQVPSHLYPFVDGATGATESQSGDDDDLVRSTDDERGAVHSESG